MDEIWLTPSQLIAINLREARELKGLTQEEAALVLEPHLGTRWSKGTFSAVEAGSIRGDKIRQFTADDIVAFSQAFQLPFLWFLIPPATWDDRLVRIKRPEVADNLGLSPAAMTELLLSNSPELKDKVVRLLAGIPRAEWTERQREWSSAPLTALGEALETLDELGDGEQMVEKLRAAADLLVEARRRFLEEVDHSRGMDAQYDEMKNQ